MSKILIKNLPAQTVRSMKLKHADVQGLIQVEYGHLPENFSGVKVTAKHLLFIYLSRAAKLVEGEWKFCIPVSDLAEDLSLSTRQVTRSISELVRDKMIESTGIFLDRVTIYIIPRPYNNTRDFAIPEILAITKTIPLALKLFILRLQLKMAAREHEVYVFSNQKELRELCNNSDIISSNLAELESRGLIIHKKTHNEINIKEVYSQLYQEFISGWVKSKNKL